MISLFEGVQDVPHIKENYLSISGSGRLIIPLVSCVLTIAAVSVATMNLK